MALIRKLIAGGGSRRSRLHDEKGNRIGFGPLLVHGPRAAAGWACSRLGRRPEMPWIAFTAIARLERLIRPDWRVAEFGSGMSTLWFAGRCAFVASREDSQEWHARVAAMLRARGITHVDLVYATGAADYASLDAYPAGSFDLVLVDGSHRDRCAAAAKSAVKPGGLIYLDNSDKESAGEDPDAPSGLGLRGAESALLEEVRRRGGTSEYFVDFAPAQCFVSQGMLCRMPAR